MSRHSDHEENNEDDFFPTAPSRRGVIIADHALQYNQGENIPSHLIFELEAGVESQLIWEDVFKQAIEAVNNGFKIVFQLNLGFKQLQHPLRHEGQFQALLLSMRHFRKEIASWANQDLFGVILYRGSFPLVPPLASEDPVLLEEFYSWLTLRGYRGDPLICRSQVAGSEAMSWNYSRFCHEECIEYIRNLSLEVPDVFHRFIQFDLSDTNRLADALFYSAKDLLEPMHPVIRSSISHEYLYPIASSLYGSGYSGGMESLFLDEEMGKIHFQEEDQLSLALLLPSYQSITYEKIEQLLRIAQLLSDKKIAPSIKIMHEPFFTTEWHNVDRVIVSKNSLSKEGIRMLLGFEAAGGEVLNIDVPHALDSLFS
ncbi:MAG: hypothetical protein QRY74_00295 [Chlamydia sp.]